MKTEEIAQLRRDYTLHSLTEADVASSPVEQFAKWWDDATQSQIVEINAMILATVADDGFADARTVLLKGFDETGFIFFTNYDSVKGKQLALNPKCCLLFHWKELERQIRITGIAEKISVEESNEYFDSRPDGSKIGAWASPQSKVVENKSWLEGSFNIYSEKFKQGKIPKPPHWGGYRVKPAKIEFWQGRPSRMHDRILYTETGPGKWKIERLAP